MAEGKVKWFDQAKGYGFIQPSNGGADVFVHITALQQAGIRHLNENQSVAYEVANNKGKMSAVDLKLLS